MSKIPAIPAEALETIKAFEGFRAKAYPDPVLGWKLPTIGYGTTCYPNGNPVARGDMIGEPSALECLVHHLDTFVRPKLERIPTWGRMTARRQAALYSFAYNLGPSFYGREDFASITAVCDTPARWERWCICLTMRITPISSGLSGLRKDWNCDL